MNFIGGNNYLSDPDSDAELASMTGGDDSSVYPDSEAGSESVYSGGMELSDYELDSQCGGDTDAAILQMGGYQSDENVVVPTVAEQKGGANNEPTTHEVEAAVAVSATSQREQEEVQEPVQEQVQELDESKVDYESASGNHVATATAVAENNGSSVTSPDSSTPLTEEQIKQLNNKLNFHTLLGTLHSYEQLKDLNLSDLFDLCKTDSNEIEGKKKPKIPEEDINNFIETKINEVVGKSANGDNLAQGNDESTVVKTSDELFRLIVKCKTLSFLLMSGFSIDTNKTITVEYKKENNKYELNPPLKYE